jgi:2'-5' RNA ligase
MRVVSNEGLAIELYFDAAAGQHVTSAWSQAALADAKPPGDPHVSLTVMPVTADEPIRRILRRFIEEQRRFTLRFSAVGSFPTAEGVVFLMPVVTQQLLDAHSRLYRLLDAAGIETWQYYRPGYWVPHMTVGLDLNAGDVCRVFDLWRKEDVFGEACVTEIGLIKFRPVETLYRLPLSPAC